MCETVKRGCHKPVEHGLCPRYGGRKSACCHAHARAAKNTEGSVHPGLIVPGTRLVSPLNYKLDLASPHTLSYATKPHKVLQDPCARRNAAQRATPQVASDPRGLKPTLRKEAVEDIVRCVDKLVCSSSPSSLPALWVQRATSTRASPAFISVFDGNASNSNRCCNIFGIHGMPPGHLCWVCPVNM